MVLGGRLNQMRFTGAAKSSADAVLQFLGGEQPRWLRHPLLASQPLGLDWVEPRTLGGQVAGDQPHALAGLLDLPVVLAHPRAHDLAVVPGGVVPDQQHGARAALLGTRRTPAQEVDGDRADGAALDEAQPEILAAAGSGVPAAR